MTKKTRLINCQIIDGSGSGPFPGEILIEGARISAVSAEGVSPEAEVLDCAGAFVAPGFIDVHSHTDLAPFVPGSLHYKLLQGVTTEICGQCGLSVAPVPRALQDGWRERMVIGDCAGSWPWDDFEGYLQALDRVAPDCNMVPFVGHGTLRWTSGGRGGALSRAGLERMTALARDSFAAGAAGLSLGLIYYPALFAGREELEAVLREAGRAGVTAAVHLRSESDELAKALEEMIAMSETAGCRLHLSHLKCIGFENRPQLDRVLELLEQHGILFDSYPYTTGSTTLASLLPPFLMEQGLDGALEQLRDPAAYDRLRSIYEGMEQLPSGLPWDNLPGLVGWERILIDPGSVPSLFNRSVRSGFQPVSELARESGLEPAGLLVQLLEKGGTGLRMLDTYMDEEALKTILKHPSGMTGSDSLTGPGMHPRVTGSFPRLFGRYVFGEPLLSLEEAVARCSSRAAAAFGLRSRGRILPGYYADLVVFDASIRDRSSFDRPAAPPEGIRMVFVNGELRVRDAAVTGSGSGMLPEISRRIYGGSL